MVYVFNATEFGTLYTKPELQAISELCKENGLLLLLDGARLGAALTAETNDLKLQDIAELTDIFWIGGTKTGALLGEAIVIPNPDLRHDFNFHLKQRGALLAKGRVLGLQFRELFQNGLFFELARHANNMAGVLSRGIERAGFSFIAPTETNQVFPILPNDLIEHLQSSFEFHIWGRHDEGSSVARMVTSWATNKEVVDAFLDQIGIYPRK